MSTFEFAMRCLVVAVLFVVSLAAIVRLFQGFYLAAEAGVPDEFGPPRKPTAVREYDAGAEAQGFLGTGPQPGETYVHFKYGDQYEIVCRSVDADTREQLVTYRNIANDWVWTRSLDDFLDPATNSDGVSVPRFLRVKKAPNP